MLGINRERVKYSKKQGVFAPDKTSTDGKNAEYTEIDVATLRKLVILTKSVFIPLTMLLLFLIY